MTAIEQLPTQPTELPAGLTFHSWYCPALSAFRSPDEVLPAHWQHLLTQLPWVPLYAAEGAALPALPEGWTLRAYYAPDEKGFYASHRTMSDKTAKSRLVELHAPPGAYGNDCAAHVPPKKP
jgi:hypothetical protein